ncbi:3189_t:CDS:2, partial [Entrophospora sp. SA101]
MVMTPERKEFLYCISDFSSASHTGEFLAEEINKIIECIGPKKVAAIVSDNGANIAKARRIVTSKYKHIINVRCIAHCINLISKDVIAHKFAKNLISKANIIVKYFKKSSLANSLLKSQIEKHRIQGGIIKSYVKTRWTSVHECLDSIIRLKRCLEEIRDEHSTSISNNSVISILRSRAFFEDVGYLANTLLPIKLAILEVEGRSTNLADCYISLLRIAAVIRNLPSNDYKFFRNHCISVFNKRYKEFDDPIYLLAFFLHPAYKGNGVKYGQFYNIVSHAGSIWKSLGKNRESWESLSTQLRLYKLQKDDNGVPNVYSAPYTPNQDTVMSWWNTCEANPKHLQQLALRIFSITPSSASCERMFSTLGWLYGKKWQNLSIHKLESLAKVYRYNISEVAQTTNHLKRSK